MVLFLLFLGGHAMVAQIYYIREALAAHGGQEGVIGFAFAFWFLMGAAGAWRGRRVAVLRERVRLRVALAAAAAGLAVWTPVGGEVLARGRALWGGSAYEPLSPGFLFFLLGVALFPTAFLQGFCFPIAARLHREERGGSVGALVGADAVGAMAGGLWMAWEAVSGRTGPVGSAMAAVVPACASVAAAVPAKTISRGLGVITAVVGIGVILMPFEVRHTMETAWEKMRWAAGAGRPGKMLERLDTPYQRLILAQLGGQRVLYGNAQALFLFPDPAGEEPLAFSIAARHSGARSVLVMGAVSPDFRRVLCTALPGSRITEVEADAGIYKLSAWEPARHPADSSCSVLTHEDPLAFTSRQPAESYDLIVLRMPEPSTLGLARFYTVEFYEALRRILRPSGILWTSVEATELLGGGTEMLPAAVWKSLRWVFPKVAATYGSRIGFFAGREEAELPMDAERLTYVARQAGWETPWFDPGFFETDEASDPMKRSRLEAALSQCPVEPLRRDRPVGHLLALVRWGRLQGSLWAVGLASWAIRPAEGLARIWGITMVLGFAALGFWGAWIVRRAVGRYRRTAIRMLVGTAGFSAIALEISLMFLAQSRMGYLYERLAILVTLFMAGHAGSAWWVRGFEGASARAVRTLIVAAGGWITFLWAFLLWWAGCAGGGGAGFEAVLMGLMFGAGVGGGVLFPVANRLMRETGAAFASAAGDLQAADLLGAVVGSLLPGLVLLPQAGVVGSSALLTILMGGSTVLFALFVPN